MDNIYTEQLNLIMERKTVQVYTKYLISDRSLILTWKLFSKLKWT